VIPPPISKGANKVRFSGASASIDGPPAPEDELLELELLLEDELLELELLLELVLPEDELLELDEELLELVLPEDELLELDEEELEEDELEELGLEPPLPPQAASVPRAANSSATRV
jgi:hypothetical protein